MSVKNFGKLVVSLALPQVAGFVGSIYTLKSVDGWYQTLEKSALTPPNFVFAPVWTLLYVLMGLAAYLVWRRCVKSSEFWLAPVVFLFQLVLNSLWSIAFFGWQSPGLALGVIATLWVMIVVNMVVFYRLSRAAAWLLLPYLLWVTFASYLNWVIWMLN